jgi:Fe-S cluster assembly ATP-binding protein
MLSIQNYSVKIADTLILHDCTLHLKQGSIHVLMGPNGSGKSSLLMSLMGHPVYTLVSGTVFFDKKNMTELSTSAKSLQGFFLAMQHTFSIEGLTVLNFLQELARAHQKMPATFQEFLDHVKKLLSIVGLPESILQRCVNVGFSGGEKKRFELLQMLLLEPKFVMLDEIDSGVDVDGLKIIAQVLSWYKEHHPEVVLLIVTHYRHILDQVSVDGVHIMLDGRIVRYGDKTLLDDIEQFGYERYAKRSE